MEIPQITIVTGPRDSGKSSWLRREFDSHGGVGTIMPKVYDRENHIGYNALILPSMEKVCVCRRKTSDVSGKKWEFLPGAFSLVKERVRAGVDWDGKSPFYIDEIGSLELAGEGHAPLLREILSLQRSLGTGRIYLGMRLNLVEELIDAFDLGSADILILRLAGH